MRLDHMSQRVVFSIRAIVVIMLSAVFAGCPQPIDIEIAQRLTDDRVPTVTIEAPRNNSQYAQRLDVSGTTTDSDGTVREVRYSVTGILGVLAEEVLAGSELDAAGAFSFSFSTTGFSGPIQLTVESEDWNDNVGSASITLEYSGSQLSSFAANPGNKTVSLGWEGLPEADSYTIYYTDNGTLPTASYGERVEVTGTSYELTSLSNGVLYTFLLSANEAGAPEYWSNYITAIPLSQFTLAPKVRGGYRSIDLEWQGIYGTAMYEVHRATSPHGPYANHTGPISATSFTDTGVADGVWYYYKVRPVVDGAELSTFNAARTVEIPDGNQHISSIAVPQATEKIALSGNHAYVTAGSAGLLVIDVSNPAAPTLVGSVATTDATDVVIAGSVAYVTDGAAGVRAIDISSPTNPQILDTYDTGLTLVKRLDVDPETDVLFVIDDGDTDTTLYALDVSDPTNIQLVATRSDGVDFFDIAVANFSSIVTMIYLSGGSQLHEYYLNHSTGILWDYEFFDPAAELGGGTPLPGQIAVNGPYVYSLATVPFDIEPPPEYQLWTYSRYPSALENAGSASSVQSGNSADIFVAGTNVYAVDEYSFHIYDVSDPAAPEIVYSVDTPGSPTGVVSDGSHAYIATGTRYFQTVDLNLPTAPAIHGEYTASGVYDVRVRDSHAYVTANSPRRMQILDVSSLDSPAELGSVSLEATSGLALTGEFAFIVDGSKGLKIADISNPADPVIVGSVPPITGTLYSVDILGDFAYAAGSGGIEVYDISDPANPFDVALLDADPGGMNEAIVHRGTLYAIDGAYFQPTSLKIIDISSPTQPVVESKVTGVATSLRRFGIWGDYAYITDELSGVVAVDINRQSADYRSAYGPVDPDSDSTTPTAYGVAPFGNYAFVTNPDTGLAIMDVAEPGSMTPLSSTGSWSGNPETVRFYGAHVYVADRSAGLKIIRLRE